MHVTTKFQLLICYKQLFDRDVYALNCKTDFLSEMTAYNIII